jgi:hypothetical protein
MQRDGGHAAEHHELALREVDDPGRVVDDVEPDGDDRVDRPVRDPRDQILKKEFQVRVPSSNDREHTPHARTPDRNPPGFPMVPA